MRTAIRHVQLVQHSSIVLRSPSHLLRPSTVAQLAQFKHTVASNPLPKQQRDPHQPPPLKSSITLTAIGAGIAFVATAFLLAWDYSSVKEEEETSIVLEDLEAHPGKIDPTADGPVDPLADMPVPGVPPSQIAPGRPGNLTPDQEARLKEFWIEVGKLTGQYPEGARLSIDTTADDAASTAESTPGSSKKKKSRFGFGRKSKGDDEAAGGEDIADKHGSNKEFKAALANMSQAELRDSLWEFCKGDDPDANMCRYLRARKWNVHDALVMLISTIHWRKRDMDIEAVMTYGEEFALKASKGQPEGDLTKKLGQDMVDQLAMGKSFLHGCDREGRPLCFVRVKLHKGGEYSEESLNRLTVFMIETARFMLRPPVDTAVIIFDMTGFSLANMDYTPVKFMIKVFEANYPESLGAVLVHKAPWVFQGIWSVIKGWLDPVVASKISFTKEVNDLEKFIDVRNIPKSLGGQEDWEYTYTPPLLGENAQMSDKQARAEIFEEREQLLKQFEANTEDWVLNPANKPETQIHAERQKLSQQLHDNYWRLDPFIRARSMYDRIGNLQEGGKVDFYPPVDFKPRQGLSQAPQVARTQVQSGAHQGSHASQVPQNPTQVQQPPQRQMENLKLQDANSDARSVKSVYHDANEELD